jgi:hypothetical protein
VKPLPRPPSGPPPAGGPPLPGRFPAGPMPLVQVRGVRGQLSELFKYAWDGVRGFGV